MSAQPRPSVDLLLARALRTSAMGAAALTVVVADGDADLMHWLIGLAVVLGLGFWSPAPRGDIRQPGALATAGIAALVVGGTIAAARWMPDTAAVLPAVLLGGALADVRAARAGAT